MKHFKLTSESKINLLGKRLFRIECTVDFKYAEKGDKGGWVEKEDNISGDAWVSGNAEVSGNAKVYDYAEVSGNAKVSGDAWVSGNAKVYDYAEVSGNAKVYDYAEVSGNAVSTKKVFTLNFIYNMTVTDNHIKYGCKQRTFKQWEEYLKSDEVIETERDSPKFKIIESALKLAIKYKKYND